MAELFRRTKNRFIEKTPDEKMLRQRTPLPPLPAAVQRQQPVQQPVQQSVQQQSVVHLPGPIMTEEQFNRAQEGYQLPAGTRPMTSGRRDDNGWEPEDTNPVGPNTLIHRRASGVSTNIVHDVVVMPSSGNLLDAMETAGTEEVATPITRALALNLRALPIFGILIIFSIGSVWALEVPWWGGLLILALSSLLAYMYFNKQEYANSRNALETVRLSKFASLKEKEMDQSHEIRTILVRAYLRGLETDLPQQEDNTRLERGNGRNLR